MDWHDYIAPDGFRGKPMVRGTSAPVSFVLGYLASGKTPEEVIQELPGLRLADVAACVAYARDLAESSISGPLPFGPETLERLAGIQVEFVEARRRPVDSPERVRESHWVDDRDLAKWRRRRQERRRGRQNMWGAERADREPFH